MVTPMLTLVVTPVVRKAAYLITICLCLLVVKNVYAAEIKVQLDRSYVQMDESFTVVFSASDSVDGDPDFSPLQENFRTINRNQSSSIRIINGSMSRETTWTLSLMPRQAGKLQIPAISFGSDKSKPTTVVVRKVPADVKSQSDQLIFMEVSVEPKQIYVQAQIIYTVRIYHAVNLMDASLAELKVEDGDTIVEALGSDSSFDKQINGRHYKVFEKKYALFPQKSGTIKIPPLVFETRYVGNRRNLKQRRILSKEQIIEVKPKPKYEKGKKLAYWLPASSLQVSESLGKGAQNYTVGQPVTRTLRITAEGLPASLLPNLQSEKLDFAKVYPDQPILRDGNDSNGITGVREDKFAIIPTKSGEFVIPEIKIPWWNTKKDQWEHVVLKARKINVKPAPAVAGNVSPTPILEKSIISAIGGQDEKSDSPLVTMDDTMLGKRFWFALSMLFLYLWLLTIVAWWYYSKRAKNKQASTVKKQKNNLTIVAKKRTEIEKRLKLACDESDLNTCKVLLIEWAGAVFHENSPHSLTALAKTCGGTLGDEIRYLNKLFYSNSGSTWKGESLLKLLKGYSIEKEANNKQVTLTPLFHHVSE